MDHQIFRTPLLSFIFRTGRAIPIASRKEDPEVYERAFAEVRAALAGGELVGIFPEGGITRDGEIASFRPGITRILTEHPVPVIPAALAGLWGSYFSRKDGPAMTRPMRRGMFSRIELSIGAPVEATAAEPEALRQRVLELRGARK